MKWGALPEAMPEHYALSGLPDRIVETSLTNWFLFPTLSVIVTILLYLSFYANLNPEKWNIFEEGEFTGFSGEKQNKFKETAKNLITMTCCKMAVTLNLLFLMIQVINYMIGTGKWQRLPNYSIIIVLVLIILVIAEFIVRFLRLKDNMSEHTGETIT
jgi:uncharacterized membrane protein